jgi:hypothetical protein
VHCESRFNNTGISKIRRIKMSTGIVCVAFSATVEGRPDAISSGVQFVVSSSDVLAVALEKAKGKVRSVLNPNVIRKARVQ